jgi:SAM-dependent methyltransferase
MATGTGDTFAFDAMAADYDDGFTHTELGQRLRRAVHRRLDHHFQPGHRVLELNCGTGEDAVHLARRGVHVVATDRSPEMIRVTRAKARRAGVADRIQAQPLAMEDLDPGLHGDPSSEGGSSRARPPDPGFTPGATQFHPEGWETGAGGGFPPSSKGGAIQEDRGDFCIGSDLPPSSKRGTIQEDRGGFEPPFDGAFSNFGGLNCVDDLEAVARRLAPCLKPGAPLLLCIMGPSVPWEWAWYLLHREPKKAFRRWTRGGVPWRGITIRYPSIGAARRAFQPDFHARRVAGVGTFLPPTYAEPWAARHPRLLNFLERWERRLERCPPIPHLADHYLLELERR